MAPVRLEQVAGGATVQIDASIGVTTAAGGTLDELPRVADADMYREKARRPRPAAHRAPSRVA